MGLNRGVGKWNLLTLLPTPFVFAYTFSLRQFQDIPCYPSNP